RGGGDRRAARARPRGLARGGRAPQRAVHDAARAPRRALARVLPARPARLHRPRQLLDVRARCEVRVHDEVDALELRHDPPQLDVLAQHARQPVHVADRRRRVPDLRLSDRLLPRAEGAEPPKPDRALHHRARAVLDELPRPLRRLDVPARGGSRQVRHPHSFDGFGAAGDDPALHPVHGHAALLHARPGGPNGDRGGARPRRQLVADVRHRDPAADAAGDRDRIDLHLRADDGRVRHRPRRRPELRAVRRHDRQLVHRRRGAVPAGRRGCRVARAGADRGRVRDHPLFEPPGRLVSSTAMDMPRPQDRVITRPVTQRDWSKWGLAVYFVIFLVFLYGPMIVMAILSLQGYFGGVTFPFKGPLSSIWWRSLVHSTVAGTPTHAAEIHTAAKNSLYLSLAAGAIVSVLAFTLSMAFRRRWRFRSDAAAFYVIMLALMTPGFLLAVGT